jgi:hypothetical protein
MPIQTISIDCHNTEAEVEIGVRVACALQFAIRKRSDPVRRGGAISDPVEDGASCIIPQ